MADTQTHTADHLPIPLAGTHETHLPVPLGAAAKGLLCAVAQAGGIGQGYLAARWQHLVPPPRHRAVATNAAERIPIDKQHERTVEVGECCHYDSPLLPSDLSQRNIGLLYLG